MKAGHERRAGRWFRALIVAAAMAALAEWLASPAQARPWKPTSEALALDYGVINHQRSPSDLVMVMWLTPQMLRVASEEARALLDKYAMIGIAHGHMLIGGTMSYDPIGELQATNGDGKPLILLSGDNIPPTVQGALVAIQAVLKKMMGPMGEGIHWFVYEAGSVHSCEKGALAISYDGETYTYETPIPGCPAQ